MKELRYIKLFESFDSVKLKRTIGFLNKETRNNFIKMLKNLSNLYDFPISEFNDDFFDYLSFNAALKKKPTLEKEPCNHESDWIPGEYCEGGRVKRTWGSGYRTTTCTYCNGTGFKVNRNKHELQLIKFWFDKDGNWVATSGYDGKERPQPKQLYKFSPNLEDYNEGETISPGTTANLPTGTIIKFGHRRVKNIVCMITRQKGYYSDKIFLLNNSPDLDGSKPDNFNKEYSEYSWQIDGSGTGENSERSTILNPKNNKVQSTSIDYNYNVLLNNSSFRAIDSNDVKDKLKNAHFALVLDLSKLSKSKHTTVSDIRSKREIDKEGAFISNEQVRKINLDRYLSKLVSKFDTTNISSISKILPRSLGWSNSIVLLYNGNNLDRLNVISNDLYKLIKGHEDSEYLKRRISSNLDEMYKTSSRLNFTINNQISKTYKLLDNLVKDGDELSEKRYDIFNNFVELGELLNKKIVSLSTDTLADLEISLSKIESIRNIMRNDRLNGIYQLRYVIDYLRRDEYNVYDELMDINATKLDSILNDLESLKKIITNI